MTANSAEAQTIEVDLSVFTNWSGTQANWWFQLVENPGDGAVASAGIIDIQQILFATESINPANVSFSVDMSNYPGGLAESDTVYVNGSFNGWCGDCNPMSDDDGDGIWTVTLPLDDGDYQYKFTVNGWNNQEQWTADGTPDCAENADDGQYENRAFSVAGEDLTLPTVYWGLCVGEEPGTMYTCLLYTSPSPRDLSTSRMPSSA